MKVGILGSGGVGQALGKGFADLGHDVKMGTRDMNQEKVKAWLSKSGPRASAGSFAEAAAFGEIIVLATPWSGTENALNLADKKNLAGKLIIDVTNPLVFAANRHRHFRLVTQTQAESRFNAGQQKLMSSRRSTSSVVPSWSTRNSPEAHRICSFVATTRRQNGL